MTVDGWPGRRRTMGFAALLALLLVGCVPLATVTTLLLLPFWSWVEATFAVEAVGHSGPADWCYWTAYVLWVALLGGGLDRRLRRRRD
jgi:hypothetical protein